LKALYEKISDWINKGWKLQSSPMDRLIGVFLVALSAACFGTNAIFARMAYDAGANASTFLFIRFVIASLVMFLIMTARGLNFNGFWYYGPFFRA
jgi:drug/metabolite transporter (DMT)-like permease